MLVALYVVVSFVGLAIAVASSIHYIVIRRKDRAAEGKALADAMKARERGVDTPLPDRSVFWPGTLAIAFFTAFVIDGLISFTAGTFAIRDVAQRAMVSMVAAGGVQYTITAIRKDNARLMWPNSPWAALVVAGIMGALGGAAEASSPGAVT